MSGPRVLTIIGSGETAPTLAKVHRAVLARFGGRDAGPVPAVLIDTPYGFQENADDISGRTIDYFRESVGAPIAVASFRSADVGPLERATAVARIRDARFVFTGPGSPSYALAQWRGSEIPPLLAEKLATGGAVTFASAAALTIGAVTVPVYEIYKVGEAPRWLEGLDLLGALGIHAAVIPHYDNAEGGNHDTRFCYLGERRLLALEAQLPAGVFILGVDGHTALTFDLEAGTASVAGNGTVTIRRHGDSEILPAGTTLPLDELIALGRGGAPGGRAAAPGSVPGRGAATEAGVRGDAGDLPAAVRAAEAAFTAGIEARDPAALIRAVLELDESVVRWSRDTGDTADYEAARAVVRALIVRLGELGVGGLRDPREPVAPFVDALLELRVRARDARDWAAADLIRDRLLAAGVEVRDGPDGTTWELGAPGPAEAAREPVR